MEIKICIGSSCHLKGSQKLVEQFRDVIVKNGLQNKITLAGSFCAGMCNREGVTITVDDKIYTGITPESFNAFFDENIMTAL